MVEGFDPTSRPRALSSFQGFRGKSCQKLTQQELGKETTGNYATPKQFSLCVALVLYSTSQTLNPGTCLHPKH